MRLSAVILIIACIMLVVLLFAKALVLHDAHHRRVQQSLTAVPSTVILGSIDRRSVVAKHISLINQTKDDIAVLSVNSSCECLRAEPGTFNVSPGDRMDLSLIFDVTHEQSYIGGLQMNVEGITGGGHSAFRVQVQAELNLP